MELGSLPESPHATVSPNPGATYSYFQLTDEKTEAQRGKDIAQSHTAIGGGLGFELKKFSGYRVSLWRDFKKFWKGMVAQLCECT